MLTIGYNCRCQRLPFPLGSLFFVSPLSFSGYFFLTSEMCNYFCCNPLLFHRSLREEVASGGGVEEHYRVLGLGPVF